ncbi:MAG: GNAT family N-acetyltransferase [Pseudomonadota bacterium]
MNATHWTVRHNEAQSCFETTVEGHACRADYRLRDGVLRLTHTEVPPAVGGRGIAGALIQAALDHARAHRLKVDPQCSYAAAYMKRRPETLDLLA